MAGASLAVSRAEILGFRRRAGALDARLPMGPDALRRAAWAGLQDSMPRAALLSIHARVAGTEPTTWEDPTLVQIWGPRYNVFVVAADDRAVFTLGWLPDDERGRRRAEETAARLTAFLGERRLDYATVGRALGVYPNSLRFASPTGTVLMRWEGARRPTIWTVPPPAVDPDAARRELARRYLHVYGPSTPRSFGWWAGIGERAAAAAFASLGDGLLHVRTPLADAWILPEDEPALRAMPFPPAAARLLPSGDSFWLYQDPMDRELLVADPSRRRELWTPRVWPGCLLVDGDIAGTWRRGGATVTVSAWSRLSNAARAAVESEAATLPLPGLVGRVVVRWEKS